MATIIRPARPSDKAPLMEFIKGIWGGHDYIPHVWDEWIRDRSARISVVEVDGKAVGMCRVRFVEDGSAWLEGARIHPDYRGMGLASMLGRRSMKVARERGARVCRLTSGSTNRRAHRQVLKMGFKETARISLYVPMKGARFKAQRRVKVSTRANLSDVVRRIVKSKEYRLGRGVFWESFSVISLTPESIARCVERGSVYISGEGVAIGRIGGEGRGVWRQVCFLAGPPQDAVKLVRHIFGRRERRRTTRRMVYLPQGSPLASALREAGIKRRSSYFLFERKTPKS